MSEYDTARSVAFITRHGSESWSYVPWSIVSQLSSWLCQDAKDDDRYVSFDPQWLDIPLPELRWPQGGTYLLLGSAWDDFSHIEACKRVRENFGGHVVAFIHDLIPIKFPEYCVPGLPFRFRDWLSRAMTITDVWIANSAFTAQELQKFSANIEQPDPFVVVTPLNFPLGHHGRKDFDFDELSQVLGFNIRKRDFVLCVGTLEPRKNHAKLIAAWRQAFANTLSSPALVIVGSIGWQSNSIIQLIETAKSDGFEIQHFSDLSDQAIDALYAHCMFTVYPSVCEGWGLPITEALAHGKIVVLGRHSGVVEAAGEFGYYVDVNSIELMAAALIKLERDAGLRSELESNIKAGFRCPTVHDFTKCILDATQLR